MPRSGKRKHRLTKKEIRNIRKMARGGPEECSVSTSSKYHIDEDDINLPSTIFVCHKPHTHMGVFEHFHPSINIIKLNYRTVSFYSEADRAVYEDWYTEYSKKFGENVSFDFPPPCDGIYPYLESVHLTNNNNNGRSTAARSRLASKGSSTELERWIWCLENCTDEVRLSGGYLYFADVEDAVLYKITFG